MAVKRIGEQIRPEIASHLMESMRTQVAPAPKPLALTLGMPQGQHWPDGNSKQRHPKERALSHGRVGQQAPIPAMHRTSRPQVPHSS